MTPLPRAVAVPAPMAMHVAMHACVHVVMHVSMHFSMLVHLIMVLSVGRRRRLVLGTRRRQTQAAYACRDNQDGYHAHWLTLLVKFAPRSL